MINWFKNCRFHVIIFYTKKSFLGNVLFGSIFTQKTAFQLKLLQSSPSPNVQLLITLHFGICGISMPLLIVQLIISPIFLVILPGKLLEGLVKLCHTFPLPL